jgi:hypothetical protein
MKKTLRRGLRQHPNEIQQMQNRENSQNIEKIKMQ